jgi:dipeptidyl aminopeptidase/acylaminoacyl peptidase
MAAMLRFLAIFAVSAAAFAAISPSDLVAVRDTAEIRLSPDGSTIAFTLTTRDLAANRNTAKLMWIPARGGAPREIAGAPEGSSTLRWAPDGKRLAFIAKKNIWLWDAQGSRVTRLCDYDRGNSYLAHSGNVLAWSPDGRQLAFSGTLDPPPAPQDPLVITRILYKTRTGFSDNRRSHLHVVPAAGGTPRAITSGANDEHSIEWAGDEIIFLSNRGSDADARLNYDLFAIDPRSGSMRQITRTPGVEMDPAVSPDGRTIAYLATTRELTTIDSVAEDTHVWAVPVAGGTPVKLNASLDRRSASPEWLDGGTVVYLAQDHGRVLPYRVPAEGGESRPLFEAQAQVTGISAARGTLVFGMTDFLTPREIFRWSGRAPERLTNLNTDLAARLSPIAPKHIRFQSFDGTPVEGWLYMPLKPEKGTPMILSIHGGPHGMFGHSFSASALFENDRGFAVLMLNPRGSTGYGQKFSDGSVNDWGGGDYRDLMAGVDHVLGQYAQIDPKRVYVRGGSYGGYMTNWIVTQTDRFRAGAAFASLSNLVSFYATSVYQDLLHVEFGGFPWDLKVYELLWDRSPLKHVAKVKTPVLFLHGEQDNDVHITQSEEMFTALRQRGIEAVFARYPREGHSFREPKHIVDTAVRTLEWFNANQ